MSLPVDASGTECHVHIPVPVKRIHSASGYNTAVVVLAHDIEAIFVDVLPAKGALRKQTVGVLSLPEEFVATRGVGVVRIVKDSRLEALATDHVYQVAVRAIVE